MKWPARPETLEDALLEIELWAEASARHYRNMNHYRRIVDEIMEMLGLMRPDLDDGGIYEGCIRARLPEILRKRLQAADDQS